ncbi:MAG TPA: cytochrome b [Acidisoma sp.]|jgi:cytochrome b561|nr:cytochrome b [Acidisoma sp.]
MASLRTSFSERYTAVAILLHWLIAAGILALIVIGLLMTQWQAAIGPMETFKLFQLHKSIGITVLLLAAVRILWRFTHKPPALPADMPAVEKGAAHGLHGLLYVWMIALPLTGWAVVSSSPFNLPTVLYNLMPWPDLPVLPHLANKAAVSHTLGWVHAYGVWFLIGILALHIGAVFRHHFIKRDTILARMTPALQLRRIAPMTMYPQTDRDG